MTKTLLISLLLVTQNGICQFTENKVYLGFTRGVTSYRAGFKRNYYFEKATMQTYCSEIGYELHLSLFDNRQFGIVASAGFNTINMNYQYKTYEYSIARNHGQSNETRERGYIIDGDMKFFNYMVCLRMRTVPKNCPFKSYINIGIGGSIMDPQFDDVRKYYIETRSSQPYWIYPGTFERQYHEKEVPYSEIAMNRNRTLGPALGLEFTYPIEQFQFGLSASYIGLMRPILPNTTLMSRRTLRMIFAVTI